MKTRDALLLAALLLLLAALPLAAQAMPWDTPGTRLLDALTGTTAQILGGLAVVVAGAAIPFVGIERGGKMFVVTLIGVSIMLNARTIVAIFT